ncbi:hypothetical protein ACB098_02G006300 [Castanea mollissima]
MLRSSRCYTSTAKKRKKQKKEDDTNFRVKNEKSPLCPQTTLLMGSILFMIFSRTSQLARSVEFYQRHVFLCYKNPQVWPSKIEASEIDQVPRLLFAAFKARKADMNKEECYFLAAKEEVQVLPNNVLFGGT